MYIERKSNPENSQIIEVNNLNENDLAKINILLKQLSPKIKEKTFEELLSISDKSKIITVRENGEIIAICNLIDITSIGASYSRCADVVVDEKYRRKGVAEKMLAKAFEISRSLGYPYMIVQTNISEREEAVAFYTDQGFTLLPDMRLFVKKD